MRRGRSRSVEIDGGATESIITLGDHSPVVVTRAAKRVFALTPLTEPQAVPAGTGPALLVAARHEVVPYLGRPEARREAADWLAGDRSRAVRLVTAPGGQGKTRFAVQVARDAAAAGWQVLMARHELDGGLLPTSTETAPVPVPAEPAGVLVVVDYADRWARADLLELLTRPEASGAKLRLLLLGRSAAFWPTLAMTLGRAGIGVSECVLPALPTDDTVRREMFDAAVAAFTDLVDPVDVSAVPRPDLSAEGFGLPLAVQMTALVAVLRAQEGDLEVLSDPAAVSRELLVREIDHWQKLRQRTPDPITVSDRVMARAVLVATLTRGLPAGVATEVLGHLGVGADPQTIVDEHAYCYPVTSQDRMLEPLYPDRLGEDFIAALLPGAPSRPPDGLSLASLADPAAATITERLIGTASFPDQESALPVLVEVARRWDHVAETLLPWIGDQPALLVAYGGTVVARAATIPALAPVLPQVGELLDYLIGPGPHPTLDVGALAVQQVLVTRARSGGDRAHLARLLTTLTNRLASVGRRAEALTIAEEAVSYWRELVGLNRDAYLPDLAVSVNNLANRLADAGHQHEALAASEEADRYCRELVGLDRDAYLPVLARSVNNLAQFMADVGHQHEALAASEEAVNYWRELVGLDRDAYLPDLAVSVKNLANSLADAGRRDEALTAFEEAVNYCLELVDLDRDAYLLTLAKLLNNLAQFIADAGHPDEALAASEEAVNYWRELVGLNRDTYLPDLAMSVNNLANSLAEVRRRDEGLAAAEEAAGYYRELDGRYPALFDAERERNRRMIELLESEQPPGRGRPAPEDP